MIVITYLLKTGSVLSLEDQLKRLISNRVSLGCKHGFSAEDRTLVENLYKFKCSGAKKSTCAWISW